MKYALTAKLMLQHTPHAGLVSTFNFLALQ